MHKRSSLYVAFVSDSQRALTSNTLWFGDFITLLVEYLEKADPSLLEQWKSVGIPPDTDSPLKTRLEENAENMLRSYGIKNPERLSRRSMRITLDGSY